jgi:hypothetical protein
MPNPIHHSTPFTEQRFLLRFVGEIFKMFDVRDSTVLAEPANRRRIIRKAAEGIIIEGKLLGKQKEAEWMAQQLLNVIDGTDQQVWECCAHLYTMESFLYQKMNEYMRLCGDEKNINVWRSKVSIFGPFGYLLQLLKFVNSLNEVVAAVGENNNIRIALCLCIDKLSETIDEAKEKWGQRVLILLYDKHYSSNFDPIHDDIVTRDIDLCPNGEWKRV